MFVPCFMMYLNVLFLFGYYLAEEERVSCFSLTVYMRPCECLYFVSLPRGALGWSMSVILSFPGHTCTHFSFYMRIPS